MRKNFRFSLFSLKDLLVAAGPAMVAVLVVCAIAYWAVDPAPSRHVLLSTGQENGAYAELGKKYAAVLAKQGIQVELKFSQGSQDNLRKLGAGEVDIGFVQSGSTNEEESERTGLESLGSLFSEPVWIFTRKKTKLDKLSQLRGMRVNVGPEGTGLPRLFRQLMQLNEVGPKDVVLSHLENAPAAAELLEGRIDALVISAYPEDLIVQMLLQTKIVKLYNFTQADAYARRLPFLSHVVMPRGIIDLADELPAKDVHLISPTATLVARQNLHPALVDLFVQAAAQIHSGPGWFKQQGQFPSPKYTEIPVASAAAKFYKDGPPLMQRYMNFWMANFFERMWVLVLALGALLIPLSKVVPPIYVWRIRSRVYRWYGQLRIVEHELDEAPDAAAMQRMLAKLDQIEERVNQVIVPLSFADELYRLRSHIHFVRQRIAQP